MNSADRIEHKIPKNYYIIKVFRWRIYISRGLRGSLWPIARREINSIFPSMTHNVMCVSRRERLRAKYIYFGRLNVCESLEHVHFRRDMQFNSNNKISMTCQNRWTQFFRPRSPSKRRDFPGLAHS